MVRISKAADGPSGVPVAAWGFPVDLVDGLAEAYATFTCVPIVGPTIV